MVTASPCGVARLSGAGCPGGAPQDPRRILASVGAVVYRWDLAADAIVWGSNAAETLGRPDLVARSRGADFVGLIEPDGGAGPGEVVGASEGRDEGSGVPYAAAYEVRTADGRLLAVEETGRWFAGADGRPATVHGLMKVGPADGETGRGSYARRRASFLRRLGPDVAEAGRGKPGLTLLAMAVENLPALNEELGYEEADAVMDAVVARLRAMMRGRDRFARLADNRFALALRGCGREHAAWAVERLTALVCAEPIATARGPLNVELAIGSATAPDHAAEAPGLLRRAEESLGVAKRRAGPSVVHYDPKAFRAGCRRREGPSELRCLEWLNGRRIALAAQPVVEAGSRAVAFHEALLRVVGDDGRVRVAADVVPALERNGLAPLADARMLELATDFLAHRPEGRMSLNVSPTTLESPDWLRTLAAHLGGRPGVADRLIMEVTETAAIRDPDATRRTLDAMKAMGVGVAIDDFGSGHTSFRHLRDFPVDILKLDGVFVQNLPRSPHDRFFVQTLVDLAGHLGIATVAEWVEDEETAASLASLGIDFLQGDHCGAPALVGAPRPEEVPARAA